MRTSPSFGRVGVRLIGLVVLAVVLVVPPAPSRAAGVVGTGTAASCTEAAFTTALGGGGLVTFNCGPAALTILLTGETILTQDTTIDGGGSITLSGGNSTPLLYVAGGKTVELRKLTISNGYNNVREGGAIRNDGTLVLVDTVFRDNQTSSEWSGGAIVSYGTLAVTNSTFENNRGGNAGAIYAYLQDSVTTITGSVFRNNQTISTSSGWGGAMLIWDGARAAVRDSQFIANRARNGGALYVRPNSALEIDGGEIRDNVAATAGGENFGGGIFNAGQLRLGTVRLINNTANKTGFSGGGGIANLEGGSASMRGGVLSGNSGNFGGAVANYGTLTIDNVAIVDNRSLGGAGIYTARAELTVSNTTISGNQATSLVGGVYPDDTGTVTLINVTIATNTDRGLGTYSAGLKTVTLVNTLLAGNTGGNCGPTPFAQFTSQFSLSDDASCAWTGGGNLVAVDARLAPLADNGGATLTQMPQPGSPALDGGTGIRCPATDQRGVARPQGLICDIGAVERIPEGAPSPGASPAPGRFRSLVPLVQR